METALREPPISDVVRNARRLDLNGHRPTGYRWEEHRSNMTQLMSEGVKPAKVFQDGVLLEGMRHTVFADNQQGKTWFALWLCVQAIERGETVVYLDQENGAETIAERLHKLGITNPDAFNHYPWLPMDTSPHTQKDYAGMLDAVQPDLLVFDSWAGFLSLCDLKEDVNADCERWSTLFLNPAMQRRITSVVLDHVGHGNRNRARGGKRKGDLFDVSWKLSLRGRIDTGATMTLDRKKNRRTELPDKVAFTVGDSPEGFRFERTDAPDAAPSKAKGERVKGENFQLMILRKDFGEKGATRAAWKSATESANRGGKGISGDTFNARRDSLIAQGKVEEEDDFYYPVSQDS